MLMNDDQEIVFCIDCTWTSPAHFAQHISGASSSSRNYVDVWFETLRVAYAYIDRGLGRLRYLIWLWENVTQVANTNYP